MLGRAGGARPESLSADAECSMVTLTGVAIRVEFVSELGLAEAGIDRTGVCKGPLEDEAGSASEVR